MKQIYSTLLLLVLLIFPSLLFATEPESVDRVPAIRGVVYDETDTPLASATVQIEGTTNGTTTNSEGRFILRNLARKVYKINVSFVGYATQTRTVDLTSRSVAQLSFTLLPDDNLLSTVEVFGERRKKCTRSYSFRIVWRSKRKHVHPRIPGSTYFKEWSPDRFRFPYRLCFIRNAGSRKHTGHQRFRSRHTRYRKRPRKCRRSNQRSNQNTQVHQ